MYMKKFLIILFVIFIPCHAVYAGNVMPNDYQRPYGDPLVDLQSVMFDKALKDIIAKCNSDDPDVKRVADRANEGLKEASEESIIPVQNRKMMDALTDIVRICDNRSLDPVLNDISDTAYNTLVMCGVLMQRVIYLRK